MLEQARAGANFKAVVVFHVTNPNPVVAGTPWDIKGRVLALHGTRRSGDAEANDGCAEETKASQEPRSIGTSSRLAAACIRSAMTPPIIRPATLYDEKLCRTSFMLMRDFFAEETVKPSKAATTRLSSPAKADDPVTTDVDRIA